MADEVISVNRVTSLDNPAAMEKTIGELISLKYSGPEWKRQGLNWIINSETKEAVNLNQEAVSYLQAGPPRSDAVAVVVGDDGERRSVFIEQEAVKAAGGNMQTLKANLQTVLSSGGTAAEVVTGIPKWLWFAAGGGLLLYVATRKSAPKFGGHR